MRLRPVSSFGTDAWLDFDKVLADRRAEADEFYSELAPPDATADEALVMRQAFAGMLWSKQMYAYTVDRWLDGDPTQPTPPASRLTGRNAGWRTFDAFDIMSMPDKWEYPWFAAWDLAFHCVALGHVDPAFAKYQMILLCREWFQHPNGALPAYEWSFDDVNPPVQAWAALEVFVVDGARDIDFLIRVFDKLLVNFTWWVNREDWDGSNIFEGGFLGLDNIGPIDRSHLPPGYVLEQSDSTGWMGFYALSMAAIAAVLQRAGRPANDLVMKFLEHLALISDALRTQGLWSEEDGMFYDRLVSPDGSMQNVEVRSIVGILPLLAVAVIDERVMEQAQTVNKRSAGLLSRRQEEVARLVDEGVLPPGVGKDRLLLGVVGVGPPAQPVQEPLRRELVPLALRASGRVEVPPRASLRDRVRRPAVDDRLRAGRVDLRDVRRQLELARADLVPDQLPGRQRAPALRAVLRRLLHGRVPDRARGSSCRSASVADDLRDRLISLFLVGQDGRRPCFGWVERLQVDPAWKDNILFNEYFHGDNGAGLGASHQTGWTGIVADLIVRGRGRDFPTLGELLEMALHDRKP